MKRIAVITGATSGMGREFLRRMTAGEADEIWAVSRSAPALEKLQEESPLPVRAVPADLSWPEGLKIIEQALSALGESEGVSMLVNAAGFGKFEQVLHLPLSEQMNMTDLNCRALMALCQMCLPRMRKGSAIVNISSMSAFQPTPWMAVYGASKAYVLSYSRALSREVKSRGIRVLTVCPFWTKTPFFDRAIPEPSRPVVRKYIAMYTPEQIVTKALRDLKRGKEMSVYGFKANAQRLLVKLLPHGLVMSVWMRQQGLH